MLQIKTQTKYGVLRILRRKRFYNSQVDRAVPLSRGQMRKAPLTPQIARVKDLHWATRYRTNVTELLRREKKKPPVYGGNYREAFR